jgi:hypothetical protein
MQRSCLGHIARAVSWSCFCFGILILICGCVFAWGMRDGLGPKSHTSQGEEALSRFLTLYLPIGSISLLLVFGGLVVYLLSRFVAKPSRSLGLILLLILLVGCTAVTFLVRRRPDNQPDAESIRQAAAQYEEVIDAIERYHIEQGQYPSDLIKLVPGYLPAVPGIYIEGGEVLEYLPMPSLGEPFTVYVYGHDTEQGLRRVWEEWELRYCRQDSCTYSSDYYPPHHINENWIWIYRSEDMPLFSRPIVWIREPETTPLPGWRYPTSEFFFVDEEAFPDGWAMTFPERITTDPTINSVAREWWQVGTSRSVRQEISRAYTIADAQEGYTKLRGQFRPTRRLHPADFYMEFEPPEEINFQSQAADEFYLACGWWTWAYCRVIARYHNYTVEMHLDLEAEYEGHITQGLTFAEIETIVRAMDAKFAEGMGMPYPGTE